MSPLQPARLVSAPEGTRTPNRPGCILSVWEALEVPIYEGIGLSRCPPVPVSDTPSAVKSAVNFDGQLDLTPYRAILLRKGSGHVLE